MTQTWQVTFEIYRKKGDQPSFYDHFALEVDPDWFFHMPAITPHAVPAVCWLMVWKN